MANEHARNTSTDSLNTPATTEDSTESFASLLWEFEKGEAKDSTAQAEPLHVGQMRNFKIVTIDSDTKQIALELTT